MFPHYDHAAKLILRLALGVFILLHGIAKMTHGIEPIVMLVHNQGWPTFVAYFVYVGEVVGPILILLGVLTRLGGLFIILDILMALFLAHRSQLFLLNSQGGWELELQAMFLFSAVTLVLMGAGRYSVGGAGGRWN